MGSSPRLIAAIGALGLTVVVATQVSAFHPSGYVYLDAVVNQPVGGLVIGTFLLATAATLSYWAVQPAGAKVLVGLTAAVFGAVCVLATLLLLVDLALSRDARSEAAVLATSRDGRLEITEQRYSKQESWVSVLRVRSRDGIATRQADLKCISWDGGTRLDAPVTSARFLDRNTVKARSANGSAYTVRFDADAVTAPPAGSFAQCGELHWWW